MIYIYYSFFIYLIGVVVSFCLIVYDNWVISNLPIGDLKYPYIWSFESFFYVYRWVRINFFS